MSTGIVPVNACCKQIPPLKNPVFISDLHLSQDKPRTMAVFMHFMESIAPRFNELLILGDLFEFWAGDDHAESYHSVLLALREFSDSGRPLYIMHGNRDFLLGKDFSRLTGAVLIQDPIRVRNGIENILLAHGDEWCTADPEYQEFRATLRNPDVQRSILSEKLEHRIDLANSLRTQSRQDNSQKSTEKMDVVISDVTRASHRADSHILIHGHTHKPGHMTHFIDDFRLDRWVLPDWDFDCDTPRGGYLSFENEYLHFGHLV